MKQKKLILVKLIGIGNDESDEYGENDGDNENDEDGNNKVYKYNSNDCIEYESEDDGIEYYMYWCDSEASEYNPRSC